MFEAAEVGQKLSKKAYAEREPELRIALINAQYDLQKTGSPVIVLIAGDDRPGATAVFNRLHEWMDSRFIATHAFGPPTEAERQRPLYWRYWNAMPARGRLGIFLGGWAQSPLAARIEGELDDRGFDRAVERFKSFEEVIATDGGALVKLFLHLPKREHEKRLGKARKGRGDTWRIDETDWRICDEYDALIPVAEDLLMRTTSAAAPWHIVEATDARHRDVTCAERILEAIERVCAAPPRVAPTEVPRFEAPDRSVLDAADLSSTLPHERYKPKLEKLQRSLFKLADRAEAAEIRAMLVFEGWDAAGKGGVIRRITRALDARDIRVVPIAAPSDEELRFHYLWRFWRHVPRAGKAVIFDRSWYGRVLVERVEGFASESQWQRAYPEINEFEQQIVEAGTVLLKFWLHIDPDEQLRRFREREKTPYKKYKITDEDYRNRGNWDAYVAAVHDMVERTSTPAAPWQIVPANDKRFARVQVLETLCDALKRALPKARKG